MKYYKKFCKKGIWKFMTLSDEEVIEIEEQLRKDNTKIMINCCVDAKKECEGMEVGNVVRVAVHLFSKLADAKFTRIQSALDSKIKKAEEGTVYTSQFKPNTSTASGTTNDSIKLSQEKIDSDSEPTLDSETKQVVKD